MKTALRHNRNDCLKYNMLKFANVQHDHECDFMNQAFHGFSDSIGEGEISGNVDFGINYGSIMLQMSDGWNQSVHIDFKFCPICGIKLKNLREEFSKLLETEVWVFRPDFDEKVVRGVIKEVDTWKLVINYSNLSTQADKHLSMRGRVSRYEINYGYPIFLLFKDLKTYVVETHKIKPSSVTEGM